MGKLLTISVMAAVVVIVLAMATEIVTDSAHSEDDDLYVFVLTGQSNAAYYNYNVNATNEELDPVPEGMAFYYGTASSPIYYGTIATPTYDDTFASYGFQDMISNDRYVIGNIEAPFAYRFVKDTGKHVYIINTAISGQSISNMVSGASGDDYAADVVSHALAVIPSGYHIKMASVLFIQGESDSSTSVATYKTDFESVMSSYKSMGFGSFIISETRPSDGGNASTAQLELCDELSNVYLGSTAAVGFVNGTRNMAADGLHYSQYGDNIIGQDLADCFIDYLYKSSADLLKLLNVIPAVMVICVVAAMIFVIVRVWSNRE